MTAVAVAVADLADHAAETSRRHALRQLALLIAALAAMTFLRAQINGSSVAGALVSGALFGVGLLAVAFVSSAALRRERPSLRAAGLGLAGGAAILGVALVFGPAVIVGGSGPEPLVLWVAVTGLVAVGEEALLRGAMFDSATGAIGLMPAVVLTSVVFALMHVPLYGWSVVPVDLGAGVALCGLRILSGGITAPAVAHAVADLATWWL